MGPAASVQLSNIILFIEHFVNDKTTLISMRDTEGFTRDCHGDLRSGNIFLLNNPVLFGCIEFNEHFRQIDVFNRSNLIFKPFIIKNIIDKTISIQPDVSREIVSAIRINNLNFFISIK